jgi:hypothetical protein
MNYDGIWSRLPDSNRRHRNYKFRALPTELNRLIGRGGQIRTDDFHIPNVAD